MLLRLPDILRRTGLRRSALLAMVQRGAFPAPVRIGDARAVAWHAAEVDAWIAALPRVAVPAL